MTYKKRCECGIEITGTTEKHLESNFLSHQKSKLHKELIKGQAEVRKKQC